MRVQEAVYTDQFQGSLGRRSQSTRALFQQDCAVPDMNPLGIEPSTETARTLYERDLGRWGPSREVVSGGESCYPSSQNDYMRFFRSAQ